MAAQPLEMDIATDSTNPIILQVYESDHLSELSEREIKKLLYNPNSDRISTMPAIQPRGGDIFVFDTGTTESERETKRRDFRCDHYRFKTGPNKLWKAGFKIDRIDFKERDPTSQKGSSGFQVIFNFILVLDFEKILNFTN